ncbi:McrC family protein [Macrococcoides caseolyticum]|uniref:McrC family protein n=1 Tax=Macrococcoides caseolyticum TaxID=69966 RepID=UPI0012FE94A7|nr:hypothetical protein [Macrococcus caseolyticus]
MMNRTIIVKEYDRIYAGHIIDNVKITLEDINQLNNMVLKESDATIEDFIKPLHKGVQFKNYVGVLKLHTGLIIEILPKIYDSNNDETSKHLVLEMIRNTIGATPKLFGSTNMSENNHSMLEIFVEMFIDEVKSICQKGLVSDYQVIEDNNNYLKGKLLVHKQIKYNQVNRAKFYSEFDEFTHDHHLNRVIKTALIYLTRNYLPSRLQRELKNLIIMFEDVDHSAVGDLRENIILNRRFQYYDKAIKWAQLILQNKSLQTYAGNTAALAFLFPMEKLYEEYIANKLKKTKSMFTLVNTQHNKYSLFNMKNDKKVNVYKIKPDIVTTSDDNDEVIIIDTKWKILNRYGPSQMDLYQMYAYYTRYRQLGMNVKKVVLLYPYSDQYVPATFKSLNNILEVESIIEIVYIDFTEGDWVEKLWEKINTIK